MATKNKLTNLLRNSIEAESKSLDQQKSTATTNASPQPQTATAVPTNAKAATIKPALRVATPAVKTTTKKPGTAKKPRKQVTTPTSPAKKATSSSIESALAKKPRSKTASSKSSHKSTIHHKTPNISQHTTKTKKSEKTESFAANLAHTKLHHVVETHYHLCETCLENMRKVNDNLHDYFNQLVEIDNLNELIKLNLSYLSALPTRLQEMIAQNKSIFSDFFKFAKLEDK